MSDFQWPPPNFPIVKVGRTLYRADRVVFRLSQPAPGKPFDTSPLTDLQAHLGPVWDHSEKVSEASGDWAVYLDLPERDDGPFHDTPLPQDALEAARFLRTKTTVEFAQPSILLRAASGTSPSEFSMAEHEGWEWYLRRINAPWAWRVTHGSTDVFIAVLDTGIDVGDEVKHNASPPEDPSPEFPPERFTLGFDATGSGIETDGGHGTQMAGLIGATGDNATGLVGLNWVSPVYVARVWEDSGYGSTDQIFVATNEAIAARNDYDPDARLVINISGGAEDLIYGENEVDAYLEQAVQKAEEAGALLVAAAGNDAAQGAWYPARYSTTYACVLGIGGTVEHEDEHLLMSHTGEGLSMVAPGGKNKVSETAILALLERHAGLDSYELVEGSGTSQATALVSGAASLVWSVWPHLTNERVARLLRRYAYTDMPSYDPDTHGDGRLDLAFLFWFSRPWWCRFWLCRVIGRALGICPLTPARIPGSEA